MTEPAVEVSAITKRFAGVSAVDGISFSVQAGEIFGLVGPDGAGKTTMLRMLAGVMESDGGWVKIAGHDISADPERVHREIGYMPQGFGSYEDLTVEENIRFFADLFGVSARERADRAAQFLAAYGMSEFRRRLAGFLSGGMKKKLALICSLIHAPRLLLLDEPTTGVDPVSRREFWSILYSLVSQGVTVVISTAYLDEAERCHRLALLHRGRLLFCASPAELKASLPGTVVSISCLEPRAVQKALSGAQGVLGVVPMGDVVHLVVDDGARRIPELSRLLAAAQLPFGDIGETVATVEDVFVHAVREADTGAQERS